MKKVNIFLLLFSVALMFDSVAYSFSCTSYDEGKPRCPAVSNTAKNFPAYNSECSSCATESGAWYMWCNCPGNQVLMVTNWNSCMNNGGYLSYVNSTISCVTINNSGQGTIINPGGFSVQTSQNEVKAKNTNHRIGKTIK